jgi:hypothetical protein
MRLLERVLHFIGDPDPAAPLGPAERLSFERLRLAVRLALIVCPLF